MLAKRLIFPSLITVLATILSIYIYNLAKTQGDQSTEPENIDLFSGNFVAGDRDFQDINPTQAYDRAIDEDPALAEHLPNSFSKSWVNFKRVEIFGRVVDEYNQPLESVLISEGRYLYNTRTDSNGRYRLSLKLPNYKSSLLNILLSGYRAERAGISTEDLKNGSEVELNVTLVESSDSVKLVGWISNEIGESLPGQKIRISSWGYQGPGTNDLTVLSDDNGEFVFEAVKPDIDYKLEVYATPEYAPYSIEGLTVTRTPPRLILTLKPLKFIQISGMFVDSEGGPVPNFEIDIKNLSTGTHVRKIVSDSSGFFNLEKFPAGEMIFSSQAPEFFKIIGLTLSDNEYRNLILVVDKGIHQLSGWVSDQNGVAVDRAMVMLDAEIISGGIKSISIRSMVTDSTGKFHFDRLGDLEHMISIYAKGFNKKELPHRFQSPASEVHISLSRQ